MIVFALVCGALLVVLIGFGVAAATDGGPPPEEVALGYELAWDRLDFETLWSMSTPELRDRRTRKEFVAAKRAAYREQPDLRRLTSHVGVEAATVGSHVALVVTAVELHDGAVVHDELQLVRRAGRWQVLTYNLRAPHAS